MKVRPLIFPVVASCLVGGCVFLIQACHEADRQHFITLAAQDSRIQNIEIGGYEEEFAFTTLAVSFTIRDKPNSRVTLFIPDHDYDFRSLCVYQLGDLSPMMLESEPKDNYWSPRCPALGDDPDYRPPDLPWKSMTLSDLVTQYDELVEYFGKWPVQPEFKTFTGETGKTFRYYIEPPSTNTKNTFIPPAETVITERNNTE